MREATTTKSSNFGAQKKKGGVTSAAGKKPRSSAMVRVEEAHTFLRYFLPSSAKRLNGL